MKTALVLSGGGAGGAFQVGVLKAIWEKEKNNIDAIYGTSVGALNGAALRHLSIDALEKVWLSIKGKNDVLKFNYLSLLGLSKGKYSAKPLKKLIDNILSTPVINDKKVLVSVVNLLDGDCYYISHISDAFSDYVLASASVPFHMEPVGFFVDGGVRDHTPIAQAAADGYKRIIAICCNPWNRKQRDKNYKPSWPYLIDIGLRCTDILQSEILWNDLSACEKIEGLELIRYAPDIRIIDTFEYSPEKIRAAIGQGYETALLK